MVLKDCIMCSKCGKEMFPSAFDKDSRKITYECINEKCTCTEQFDFEEVETEKFKYVCLNDAGEITWKCYNHGYCEATVDLLFDKDSCIKFIELGCAFDKNMSEKDEEITYAETEGKRLLTELLAKLDENQIEEVADELLGGLDLDENDGNVVDAFLVDAINGIEASEYDSFYEFLDNLKDIIYDLFEIDDSDDEEEDEEDE